MSVMAPPSKKAKKMKPPKKVDRTKKAKRTKKPPKFPGLTPPPEELPDFSMEHQKAFDGMSENCFNQLHKPSKIKIRGWSDSMYYVCKECLEEYLKKHEELKKLVVRFDY